MNKLNLIIDTNYLFHKTIHISKTYSKTNKPFLSTKTEKEQFIRKVATDMVHDIKLFSGYSKIVFCVDSKSWRKKIYSEYKGNRIKDSEEINWKVFNECITEFEDIVKNKGCIVSKIDDAEADDLIFLWSRYFLKKKESSVIISADRDLTQLVDYNSDNFVVVYNNNSTSNKLVVKNKYLTFLKNNIKQTTNIFEFEKEDDNQIGNSFNIIKNIIDKGLDILEIDPEDIIFEKIMSGDKSDNIISSWTWQSLKGTRTFRITELMTKKIREEIGYLDIYNVFNNESFLNVIHTITEKISKQNIVYDKFKKNLELNYKLITLKLDTIPKYIINKFKIDIQDKQNIYAENFNRIDLLKDTKYEKSIEVVSTIFSEIDEELEPIKWN